MSTTNSSSNTTSNRFPLFAKKRSILRTKSLDDGCIDSDDSVHSTSSTISSSSSSSRSVSFDKVEIREYSVTVGDNPCCSNGPPMTLGWTYYTGNEETHHLPLDQYEQYRDGHRRVTHEMKVPACIRYDILKEWDVPTSAILNAQRECAEIQKQRSRTLERVERSSCIRKIFACKKIKKMIMSKKEQQRQQRKRQ